MFGNIGQGLNQGTQEAHLFSTSHWFPPEKKYLLLVDTKNLIAMYVSS